MNKKIELTEKQINDLNSFFEKVTAYGRTIRELSEAAKKTEDKAWEMIHNICPEAKNKECFYNRDDNTIEILEQTDNQTEK